MQEAKRWTDQNFGGGGAEGEDPPSGTWSQTHMWGTRNFSKVLEGHHPRGTTLREALRGHLSLRGLCGGLSEGSAGVSQRALRGLSEGSAGSLRGSAGVRRIFRGFPGGCL